MVERAAVILAAGQGTRMKSAMPKVLHAVGGRAMIDWSIALARESGCTRTIVVCSPGQDDLQAHVRAELGDDGVAIQAEALGTGHAVLAASGALEGFSGTVAVFFGDNPLIPTEPVNALFDAVSEGAAIGVLGFKAEVPGSYGRLVTDASGALQAIVEAKDATPTQLDIDFCNSGVTAGTKADLFRYLGQVRNNNAKGEYYLTDVVALAVAEGRVCRAVACDEADTLGVNTRAQLAAAEAAFQKRKRAEMMADGVTLVAPDTVFFSYDTVIGQDVVVSPHVVFGPGVRIGSGTVIGAFSHLEGADVASDCRVGPHARLRPGAVLESGAVVGNFVEVKAVHMGAGAKANHLAYLGDGTVGAGANIGAGTIFCNYDGVMKHQTVVGQGGFVGSNSALVAPVTIGDGAIVGSGSVITDDVPAGSLALGRAKQVVKPDRAKSMRRARRAAKKTEGN
ncbi:MAG: bifunctional UDP-N-acetylglucosamine diphosphorylase/glucosamine-1-phosphate N-acetyltransferase GlmU [Pseudomonadota bacterium]